MHPALQVAGVAFTAFLSTNIDNLLLLAALLGNAGQRHVPVLLGYMGAIATIAILGLAAAQFADTLPGSLLGYLGLVPLGMGLYHLGRALRRDPAAEEPVSRATLGAAGVGALMLSNGSDTLGVVLPLFAETEGALAYVISVTLVSSALLWFGLAQWIATHPLIRPRLALVQRWLVPILLIVLGIYILSDTATDTYGL